MKYYGEAVVALQKKIILPSCYLISSEYVVGSMKAENGVRSFAISRYDDLQPFIEEYVQPLAAQIVLAKNRSAKRTSKL